MDSERDDVEMSSTAEYTLSQACRFKAERDAAVQELQGFRGQNRVLWMEYGMSQELMTCAEEKAERLGKLVWRLQNRLAKAHRREKALRKGMREWREKAISGPVRTVSAYDLLPEEDMQTLRWVREQGGLEALKAYTDCFSNLLRECHGYRDLAREYEKRLMPEGMEWLLEVWPRWSNGEYCRFGDWWTADRYGDYEPRQLRRLVIYTPELLDEWEQGDGESYGYEWDFMRPSELDYRPDKVEPPESVDTWERVEEDIADLPCSDYCDIYRIDANDTSYEHAMARDVVLRCKALAEKENRNE